MNKNISYYFLTIINNDEYDIRLDEKSEISLIVLYITTMVLGGVGNMAIIIAIVANKVKKANIAKLF